MDSLSNIYSVAERFIPRNYKNINYSSISRWTIYRKQNFLYFQPWPKAIVFIQLNLHYTMLTDIFMYFFVNISSNKWLLLCREQYLKQYNNIQRTKLSSSCVWAFHCRKGKCSVAMITLFAWNRYMNRFVKKDDKIRSKEQSNLLSS